MGRMEVRIRVSGGDGKGVQKGVRIRTRVSPFLGDRMGDELPSAYG